MSKTETISKIQISLIILESGSGISWGQCGWVLVRVLSLIADGWLLVVSPREGKRKKRSILITLRRSLTLSMRVLSSWPHLHFTMFNIIILGGEFQITNFGWSPQTFSPQNHFSFIKLGNIRKIDSINIGKYNCYLSSTEFRLLTL